MGGYKHLATILKALGHPVRLQLIEELHRGGGSVRLPPGARWRRQAGRRKLLLRFTGGSLASGVHRAATRRPAPARNARKD